MRFAWQAAGAAAWLLNAVQVGAAPPPAADLRVRVVIEAHGELVSGTRPGGPTERRPVDLEARFDFVEQRVESTAAVAVAAAPSTATVSRRFYREARSTLRFGEAAETVSLGADARRLLVARRGTTPVPFLAEAFLSAAEFDLLDVPFDSLLLEDLLPAHPVSAGDEWLIAADVTAGLLAIDTVETGALEARLVEIDETGAKVALGGIVDGAADGVPTHVTVEATFRVPVSPATADAVRPQADGPDDSVAGREAHLLAGPVAELAAVIVERREASHVAPGFDVEARVTISRDRAEEDATFAESGLAVPGPADVPAAADDRNPPAGAVRARRSGAGAPGRVWHRDAADRFDLVHDTGWRRVEDGEDGLVMRLIDRGALVGQCSITALPSGPGNVAPSRTEVERDVERSLAGQVSRIDAADETERADGVKIVRVAFSGVAGGLPFRWIHYVLTARDGSRAGVTFMFEESLQERFGDSDRVLVAGMRVPAEPVTPAVDPPVGAAAAVPAEAGRPVR